MYPVDDGVVVVSDFTRDDCPGDHCRSIACEARILPCRVQGIDPVPAELGTPLPHLGLPVAFRSIPLGELALGDLGVVTVRWLPCTPWLVHVFGFHTRGDGLCDILQLDMDSVALAVSVRSPFLPWEHLHDVRVTVSLAHW
jgi:hypothetical protein